MKQQQKKCHHKPDHQEKQQQQHPHHLHRSQQQPRLSGRDHGWFLPLVLSCLWLAQRPLDFVAAFSAIPAAKTRRRRHNYWCNDVPPPHILYSRKASIDPEPLTTTTTTTRERFRGFGAAPAAAMKPKVAVAATADAAVLELTVDEAKTELIALLSSMTGQSHEFRRVEMLVNALESLHQTVQTLDFLNLLQQGEWQLLFSTNLVSTGRSRTSAFRLRELVQTVTCQQRTGNLTTTAVWDFADDAGSSGSSGGVFDCTGTFAVQSSYEIQQGARLSLQLQGHVLNNRGKTLPSDVPALVGLLFRALPKQLLDPTDHSSDTTYLDGNLKILRYTGPKFEAVRDIWIRKDSLVPAEIAKTPPRDASYDASILENDDSSMFMIDDGNEDGQE